LQIAVSISSVQIHVLWKHRSKWEINMIFLQHFGASKFKSNDRTWA